MRVMALFSTSFFSKCLCVGKDGHGWGNLYHTGTFLVNSAWQGLRFPILLRQFPLHILCLTMEKGPYAICKQRRSRWVHIHADWSGQSLFIDIYYSIHWFYKPATKALIRLHKCAGWSWPALSANCVRTLFMRCASYVFMEKIRKNKKALDR